MNAFHPPYLRQNAAIYLTLLSLLTAQVLSAQTWTGTTGTDWHTASNWNPATVPTAADDVTIPNVPNDPVISAAAFAKSVVIQTNGVLTVSATDSLTINGTATRRIFNFGTVTNNGVIIIGATADFGQYGIDNRATITNNAGAEIHIDRTNDVCLLNNSIFNNAGTITIGAVASVGGYGIQNWGTFDNSASSEIKIDRSTSVGLWSFGTFTNAAKITIGAAASIGLYGMQSYGIFNNNAGGEIKIDRSSDTGLQNGPSGTFTNAAKITIGSIESVGQFGLYSRNIFNNNAGGEIKIDQSTFNALYSEGAFTNVAEITIGAMASVGPRGLFSTAAFNNNAGGEINIDGTSGSALWNYFGGTFTNAAVITIGALASVGDYGLNNYAAFNNNTGGEIYIDRSTDNGLNNEAGTCTNAAKITIGAAAGVTGRAIRNVATFQNNPCAVLTIVARLSNSSTFTNSGLFTVNTAMAHTNSALTNNGILEYPQGNPIPNVTNNDLIVKPVGGECTIAPALQFGGTNSFTVGSTWYTDLNLTNPAGTYNQAANTLTITNLADGTHTLYCSISDDVNGCPRSVSIQITLDDVTKPTITCPANLTVAANGSCAGTVGNRTALATNLTDNCGTPTVGQSPAANTPLSGHNDAETVTLTADDTRGNTETCTFTVTLKDVAKPTITCPANLTVAADGTCAGTVGDRTALATNLTDNCGTPTVVGQSPAANTPLSSHNDAETVTLTAADSHGNTESCTFTVTLKDVTKPTITCPANLTVAANASCAGIIGNRTAQATNLTDNCGTPTVGQSPAANTPLSGHNDSETVTLTADDSHGNTETCTFTVTLKDVTPPAALCKAAAAQIQLNDQATITVADVDNNSTDNCGVATRSLSKTVFTCANIGANTVTLTVTDINGLSSTCNATVTITDPNAYCCTLPDARCKAAIVALVGNSVTVTVANVNDNSTAGCGLQSISVSPNTFNCTHAGTQQTVTLTITDINGNSDNCQATVTVVDNTLPTIICPNQVTVTCSVFVPAVNLTAVFASDNCGVPTKSHVGDMTTNQTCTNRKTVTRTYRATDGSGNSSTCSQVITVFDNVAPVFTSVYSNITVQCNSVPAAGSLTAFDECDGSVGVVYNGQTSTPGPCPDAYTLIRKWTATDACGNTKTFTYRITVVDTQLPNFTSWPGNIFIHCSEIPAVGTPTATDNCDAAVAITYNGQTSTPGTCANNYILTRRWTAMDNCGNTRSISQRITVSDNFAPIFTSVPANATISCTDPIPPVGTPTASDACAGAVMITYLGQTTVSSTCPGNYHIIRTWRAVDVCGNSRAATQFIAVKDTGVPVFTFVPANVTIQCNQPLPPLTNPTASDACSGYASVTYLGQVYTGGGCSADYTVTRTWRASDLCGNSITTQQVITVNSPNYGPQETENRSQDVGRPQGGRRETGLRQGLLPRTVHLQPNPTTDQVWIDLNDFAGEAVTVSIFDDLGQLIWERRIQEVEEQKLSVSLHEAGAAAGIYTVRVRSASGVATTQLVLVE
ncbi:MAG: T9SS type A sorting domain-containing protein [Saprospiraceae bacterium]